ncbi:MAG TPA: MarR family transcriptional regulator [Micromonosporaceae bacterium]|nr:MarR family transcriptional regulator [Micromonosporaceae bacterium]
MIHGETPAPGPAAEPPAGFEDLTCFALYAASRAVTGVYRPLLERIGLTYPQYLVMVWLWRNGDSGVKDIGNALQLDYGTLTPLLKRLEVLGYIRRQRRLDDERAVQVTLTTAGADLRAQATGVPDEITRALGITAAQTAALQELLRTVCANAADHARARH